MDKSNVEKLKLGIFVIVGSFFLVTAIYLIGNRQMMFSSGFEISAVFKNINGLQKGNNVRFSGINVGTVSNIEMTNDTTIRVTMTIEEDMLHHIKKDAIAAVGSDGLVGSMIINITPGKGNAGLVESGDEIRSLSRIASEDMLQTLNVTNENAALLTQDLLTLTNAMVKGKGTLGKLIFDSTMAGNLKLTIANLKMTSDNANQTMNELNEFFTSETLENSPAGVILKDSLSGEKVKVLISNLEASSMEIDSILSDLKVFIRNAKEGEGAVNYLLQDSVFVQRLDTTMQNIEEGAIRLNENMEAMKSNFLFRGYFKKQEKEAKKAAKEAEKSE
jgi:phospholipid/cholesterol/gamma-HCH transport system substrate-binding protein